MKPGISAVIVVHNQSELLQKCLKSISSWVDEIVLIDLESTEDIQSLAKTFKAKYITHKKVEIVEEVRQSSLEHASHEYVLLLDPDETIPQSLSQDLSDKIKSAQFDYFVTPRQNYVFGKWLRHSRWWPDNQVRVFRKGRVNWGSKLHEEARPEGNKYVYPEDPQYAINHLNYTTLDEFISKNMRYAKADAKLRLVSEPDFNLSRAIKLSVSELVSRFFKGEGYKDGQHGAVVAILQSFYYFMVYAYYWEAKKFVNLESSETIKSFPRLWFAHGLSETLYWDKAKGFSKGIKEKFVRRMIA